MARAAQIAAGIAAMALGGLHAAMAQPSVEALAALPQDLTHLSLEELLNIRVTSVSRVSEDLSGAPAAIRVITAADIRRSGARSLPELLRQVTGMHVARINGRSWAVTSRGFNASLSDKLEVRLDGRTLYTPLFSGVIWEAQDPPLETIDRIEVIRGPGSSLWGANAMNGVINIITRPAGESLGGVLAMRAGRELKRHVYARQGQDLGRYGQWRAYAQSRARGATTLVRSAWRDEHEISSAGLRGDLSMGDMDEFMLSMNVQDAEMGSGSTPPDVAETIRGADLTARWTRQYAAAADVQLQASFDRHWRSIPGTFGENRRQLDLEIRHHWSRGRHDVVWGAGYRRSSDEIDSGGVLFFDPAHEVLDTYNVFAQDRLSLREDLTLTLGSKFEHNSYTGLEVQPSLRLAWLRTPGETIWMAASRAARSPNRVDRALGAPTIRPNDSFQAEEAVIGELGWRRQLGPGLSVDLAGFYADYDELRGASLVEPTVLEVRNNGRGRGFGTELNLIWSPSTDWRLRFGHAWLDLQFAADPDSMDASIEGANENDPEHQLLLQGSWDASNRLQLHGLLRYVDALPDRQTPAYTELDLQLHYRWRPGLSLELGGRNLLQPEHPEFDSTQGAQIERDIVFGLRWELD